MTPAPPKDWKLLDIDHLELGDVLLERGSDKGAAIVAKATDGQFSHALMYVGGGDLIEAMPSGVRNLQYVRIGISDPRNWQLLRVRADHRAQAHEAADFARKHSFKAYDMTGALRTKLRPRRSPSFDRLFCSQLVALAYEEAGLALHPNVNASAVTQNDLFRCEVFEKIDIALKDAPPTFGKFFDQFGDDRSLAYEQSVPGRENDAATQIFNTVREDVLRLEWPGGACPGNLHELLDLMPHIPPEVANPICTKLLDAMRDTGYFELYKPSMTEAFFQAQLGDLSEEVNGYQVSLGRHRKNAATCNQRFLAQGHEMWCELGKMYGSLAASFELLIATASKEDS